MNHHHTLIRSLIHQLRESRQKLAETDDADYWAELQAESALRSANESLDWAEQQVEQERQRRYEYADTVRALLKAQEREDAWAERRAREHLKRI